ncbi:enterochelin esterase-like enzyme [Agromyces terreus]|uniref:Enterochelin esterase-like enzyme n=1 Tax=Agromyces terreus TaxID=424795 RepID=A0A9X2GZY3_9MICO|nr:alpha/beta hydrolase-fold protein [Agromyces terreus]MCP2370220.1 enterochelin esterase-like enzyme [Agromyces terreus]
MPDAVLDLVIVEGPVLITVYVIAGVLFAYLLCREASVRWALTALVVMFVGGMVGGAVLWASVHVLDLFGGPVSDAAWLWVPGAFAACTLAVWNLWRSRWWRKVIALLSIPVFAATAMLGINADYALDRTLGDLLDISTAAPLDIRDPGVDPPPADPAEPLYTTWTAPPGMPTHGEVGYPVPAVPNTISGFPARRAELYLPPAALVEDPPRLPLVIMMMGQPGSPDATFIAEALDDLAAEHDGLAPIALVIDQLGDPTVDPLCLDTELGQVETYVMQDVLPWARLHLNVLQGPTFTTVAGYSNGGGCAAYFGAKYPESFGNIVAVAPTEYAGVERSSEVLADVFGGDQAAYDEVKPVTIMEAKAPYPDSAAIFAVGERDRAFQPGTHRLADAATAAGMDAAYVEVPDAGHDAAALTGGLEEGFALLTTRMGLAPPEGDPPAEGEAPAEGDPPAEGTPAPED